LADNCCKLVRVSSDAQDERNQDADTDRHIAAEGYHVAREVRLHDKSAYKGEQEPALLEILDDIRAGRYTVVVVAHSSRIDRRDPDIAMLWTLQVRMAGGRVESVREPEYGKSDLGGRLMTLLSQEANHKYSKDLSDNIKAAHNRSRANGAYVSGVAPFGYKIVGERYNKRLEHSEHAALMREVFARVTEGHSLGAVAQWVAGQTGRRVWPATVMNWISNPAYKGFVCKRIQTKGTHHYGAVVHECPPIVTPAEWDAANSSLKSRSRKVTARKSAMLTGVLLCGNCGAKMYRIEGPSGWKYSCKRTPIAGGCGNLTSRDVTDKLCIELVSGMDAKLVTEVLVPGKNYETEIHAIVMQLQGLNLRDKADRAKQAELLDEMDRLEALPIEDDRIDLVESDRTIADEFQSLDEDERNNWLRLHGVTFTAQNTKRFPVDRPVWSMQDYVPGKKRAGKTEDNVYVTVTYTPSRLIKVRRGDGDQDADTSQRPEQRP
jgi:site-specific DNA recombinase